MTDEGAAIDALVDQYLAAIDEVMAGRPEAKVGATTFWSDERMAAAVAPMGDPLVAWWGVRRVVDSASGRSVFMFMPDGPVPYRMFHETLKRNPDLMPVDPELDL